MSKAHPRAAFKPKPAETETARRKYEAAKAAVRVAFTGAETPELNDAFGATILTFERSLAVYVACVLMQAPKRYLALAIGTDPKAIRRTVRGVEAWRTAPLIEEALKRIEAAVPRDP